MLAIVVAVAAFGVISSILEAKREKKREKEV
jgi:ABC-type lipoprotein release transport system permease subunit